jgi:ABC-2 type transport system ATP-binding protein
VEGVQLGGDTIDVTTTDPATLARSLPAVARASGIRIRAISPADESMEQVFRYLVESST